PTWTKIRIPSSVYVLIIRIVSCRASSACRIIRLTLPAGAPCENSLPGTTCGQRLERELRSPFELHPPHAITFQLVGSSDLNLADSSSQMSVPFRGLDP